MRNFEWLVPVIVFSVFVVGNILRILNWKNEQDKKAARRPRPVQFPPRPTSVQSVEGSPVQVVMVQDQPAPVAARPVDFPPRPSRPVDLPRPTVGSRAQTLPAPEDLQRALRRNRAKVQKRSNARVPAEVPLVLPVAENQRSLRNEAPPPVAQAASIPSAMGSQGMAPLMGDLFNSPDALARAMILQVIFSPPVSKRRR